jgi:hypothetical protein
MTKKNNCDWNTKEKLIANTLEWKKEKDSRLGNSTRKIFAGLSTEPFIGKSPIGLV